MPDMESRLSDRQVVIEGKLVRIARLRDEPYECIEAGGELPDVLRQAHLPADLFTFMQPIADVHPRYSYHLDWEHLSVLRVNNYDHWWSKTLNDKTRNMIRKASKSGVEVRPVDFDDALMGGIADICNETPVRQGKPFKHYGKDFATLKHEHGTFLERSAFLGAFRNGELIGFAKLVFGPNVASLMNIIAKIAARSFAPTNALIANSVRICVERNIENLHYGIWSTGGLGAFKRSHGFRQTDVPRYFLPLNVRGKLALRLGLHRDIREYIPAHWIERALRYRAKWYDLSSRGKRRNGAVAQLVEHRG